MNDLEPSIDDLQKLLRDIVIPFYGVKRLTPIRFEPGRRENDAEHSWALALVACALAPHVDDKLDIGKIAQFATVHDLVEVYAGDTTNFASEEEKATKQQRENEAAERLQRELAALPWIMKTVQEYEAQDTAEARFVKSIDKLVPLILDYIDEGLLYKEEGLTLEAWKGMMENHRNKASTHPEAYKYYLVIRELLESNPEHFLELKK
jgi:5'-deoxynucleotidase YfbR-like HD superfamily hydrolase